MLCPSSGKTGGHHTESIFMQQRSFHPHGKAHLPSSSTKKPGTAFHPHPLIRCPEAEMGQAHKWKREQGRLYRKCTGNRNTVSETYRKHIGNSIGNKKRKEDRYRTVRDMEDTGKDTEDGKPYGKGYGQAWQYALRGGLFFFFLFLFRGKR